MLAGQLTVAIENVRMYEQTHRQIQQAQQEGQQQVFRDWIDYLNTERRPSLTVTGGIQTNYDFKALRQQAVEEQKSALGTITDRDTIPLVIPIVLRGKTLGTVEYEFPTATFQNDRVLLAEELVQRLAISLDNARLFHASQLSTRRERIVNTISARLTEHSNVEDILQAAVKELGQALQTPQIGVKLNITPEIEPSDNQNGHSEA